MKDEWGPWVEHDGKGCPCVGMWVRAVFRRTNGVETEMEGRAGSMGGASWDWGNIVRAALVIRYQIRRPRGMAVLDAILAEAEKVKEGETV